jgi:hypothetical protein
LLLAGLLGVTGCTPTYLAPDEVLQAVESRDKALAVQLDQLGEGIEEYRQLIGAAVVLELLPRKTASRLAAETSVLSYYYNLGWIALIEKRADARAIYDLGVRLLDQQVEQFERAIKKSGRSTPNDSSFQRGIRS